MKKVLLLGAFAKLRKATISFVISVCLSVRPSVRMEQLGSHWTHCHGIQYLSIYRGPVEKIQVSLKSDVNTGTLQEYIYIDGHKCVCVCVYVYIYTYTHTHTHLCRGASPTRHLYWVRDVTSCCAER